MPDDKNITFKNCIGMFSILGTTYLTATVLHYYSASLLEVCLASLALFLVTVSLIGKYVFSILFFSICLSHLFFCCYFTPRNIYASYVFY